MIRYFPIILMFCSFGSIASWNEHFIKYTCLPTLGIFQVERLSVESPNNLYGSDGIKQNIVDNLKSENLYRIGSGKHNFQCTISNQKISIDFNPQSHRNNWVGGKLSIKIQDRYLTKELDFFSSVPSLSKLKINFNSSNPFIYYWTNVSSENDIFGYGESQLSLTKDSFISYTDIVDNYNKSLQ